MTENMKENTQSTDIKTDDPKDTVSKLFDDRDRDDRDRDERDGLKKEEIKKEKSSLLPRVEEMPENQNLKALNENKADPSQKENLEESDAKDKEAPSQPSLPEIEILKKKLEKTEKTLAENHRYGRSNAQKVKNAMKAVQRFADDGLLAEEEAKELLQTLHSEGEETEEDIHRHQTNPFAPIFKVGNKELENILKYTDDPHLQDKVNAFDYFLSVGSKEEIEQVLEDLTDLLDDPLKLARKMLSIGQDVYEESYKGIKESGGFKNYLSKKDQEIEKLQKKLDKLEKKLLQYEDFDKPRYRIDETGSPSMGDVEGSKPANDTISALFDERDKAGVDLRFRRK
jgi:hypothetical protein